MAETGDPYADDVDDRIAMVDGGSWRVEVAPLVTLLRAGVAVKLDVLADLLHNMAAKMDYYEGRR